MSGSMDFGVASHTSLSDSPVAHPSFFPPFRWDQWAGVIIGPVLLGFWASIAFTAFIFIGPLGLWTFIVYVIPISDFWFISYFIFRMLSMLGF